MFIEKRKQLIVDKAIQYAILRRAFVYWLFCVLFISVPLVVVNALANSHLSIAEHLTMCWSKYWLVFTLSALLLPMALLDAIKLSNGFVGPVFRLRRELERYKDHPDINFSQFRESDFWAKLAVDVSRFEDELRGNAMVAVGKQKAAAGDVI